MTLAIIGTTLVCGRFGSRVSYIKNFNLFFFLFQIIQRCDMLYLDCYWISFELAKISMVEKLISKELVNPYGLYNNSLLMGAPPHMATLRGKTHQGGILWML